MRKILIVIAMASVSSMSLAEQETMRQAKAHEHGAATLNVALEQQQLLIELESPAFNIVGFEHRPNNAEQENAVHNAEAKLRDAGQMFSLPSDAGCQLAEVDVKWSLDEDHDAHDEHDEHDDHDDHDGHDEQASNEDHHDEHDEDEAHDDHHSEGEHAEGTHSEFYVHYAFECASPDDLTEIEVSLFRHFPNFSEIDVQLIGPAGQTAVELTPSSTQINFGS